jgi:hypothetical protein
MPHLNHLFEIWQFTGLDAVFNYDKLTKGTDERDCNDQRGEIIWKMALVKGALDVPTWIEIDRVQALQIWKEGFK